MLAGKQVIKGTPIAVEFGNFPSVTDDDTQAALHFFVDAVTRERIYPL